MAKKIQKILSNVKTWSKNDLAELRKQVSNLRKEKYPRRQTPIYQYRGVKTPSYDEFEEIMRHFRPDEYREKVCVAVMAITGARISEALKIKKQDIDFENMRIKLDKEKAVSGFMQKRELPLVPILKEFLDEYFYYYEKEIDANGGYVFYSSVHKSHRPHFSPAHVLGVWREVCGRAGLNKTYGERENGPNRKKAPLYKYTLHSIRHLWGQYLVDMDTPIEVAQYLFGHTNEKTTRIYYGIRPQTAEKKYAEVFAGVKANRFA